MGFLQSDLKRLQHSSLAGHLTPDRDSTQSAIFEAVGCEHCTDGYKGRVGIFEVLVLTDELAGLIMQGANALQIKTLAEQQGFYDLKQSALLKVLQGVISIQEMQRVIVS